MPDGSASVPLEAGDGFNSFIGVDLERISRRELPSVPTLIVDDLLELEMVINLNQRSSLTALLGYAQRNCE